METSKISNLQPLFCSRAALVKVENRLNESPNADCQLTLRFNDGSMLPLLFNRETIVDIIAAQKTKVEADIAALLAEDAEEGGEE